MYLRGIFGRELIDSGSGLRGNSSVCLPLIYFSTRTILLSSLFTLPRNTKYVRPKPNQKTAIIEIQGTRKVLITSSLQRFVLPLEESVILVARTRSLD